MTVKAMSDTIHSILSELSKWIPVSVGGRAGRGAEQVIVKEIQTVMPTAGQMFVRLAGLSGGLAVALGAYGTHAFKPGHHDPQIIHVFETANRYHMLHSIALLAVPLTRRPQLVGSLMLAGMIVFSGSCYAQAFTGSTAIRFVTPYGGMLLIAAWLAILF